MATYETQSSKSFSVSHTIETPHGTFRCFLDATREKDGRVSIRGDVTNLPASSARSFAKWLLDEAGLP